MSQPKIIVTGGCGYIGSHTIVDLIENGFISNPEEGAYLDSEEGQIEIANAIAFSSKLILV